MLALEDVAQLYNHNLIFRGISCAFPAGSITLLTGDNGTGKSTLLRIMAGLSRPSSGRARFTIKYPQIGYLAHATFIYPALTAFENLVFWRDTYNLDCTREDILRLLERSDLAQRAYDRAGTFSRGMAQRLNLARILLLNPDILLLDEPATGLDANSQALLNREILLARERGACIVLVSHDVAQALPLADRVLLLEKGRFAYNGPPDTFSPPARPEQPCCA